MQRVASPHMTATRATAIAVIGLVLTGSTACHSSGAQSGDPKTLAAATAAAQLKADRHASGDYAGEWQLFTQDLRDNITQQAFVQFSRKCSPTGLAMKADGGRMDSPERAVIRFPVAGVIHTATMIYEYGGWFKEPDEFLQANFGKTGEQLIAVDEAAGHCGA